MMSAVNCIPGSDNDGDVMDVPYDHTQFLVNIHNNFTYLQISLKIGSCSRYDIYRGNHFVTPEVLHLNSSKMQTVMRVAYTRQEDGAHAYKLSLESINYFDQINTSVTCGELRGFRFKAKGASICDLQLKENKLGVRVGTLKTQPRDSSKNLYALHRWTQGAYVMAICFTLTSYLLFLLAMRILRSHTQYEFVISERYIAFPSLSDQPISRKHVVNINPIFLYLNFLIMQH